MQVAVLVLAALATPWHCHAAASPISKVISMISDLQAKVIKEGESAHKEYAEFSEWCEDRSRDLGFEIKTGKAEVKGFTATIDEQAALIESLATKVEELGASIAKDEADLKAATDLRAKEAADFAAEEKELTETLSMLERATGILEREMQGGASMLQLKGAGSLAQALTVMVQASLIDTADAAKLTAFVQDAQQAGDGGEELGAPAAAAYESHSGGIIDTLEDLTEKAEGQLADARKKETSGLHNYAMLKQSLEDGIKFATKDMDEAKKDMAMASEKKSTAEGDLVVTSKELSADVQAKADLHHDCVTKANSYEAETKNRGEELKALATAKKVIEEAVGGAALLSQVSFVQVSRSEVSSIAGSANFKAVRFVRGLAHKHNSGALAQLASQMAVAMHAGGEADPFEKVKGLISDMIAKLETEAEADATKKAYCDKELSETASKKEEKSDDIAKLGTKIGQAEAKSAKLKEEVSTLQSELSKLAKSQAEMDKLRQEEKEAYLENKAELEKGLEGIKLALKILKEYYGKAEAAAGAASGIIGLLEVAESDMSKNLAEITADEEAAVAEYEQVGKDNEIERATKAQDVKYKTKESAELDKASAELKADRSGVQAELDAVLEYLAKVREECVAKPETYAERKARREAEIAGLKEALQLLKGEAVLLQRGAMRRALRGGARRQQGALRTAA